MTPPSELITDSSLDLESHWQEAALLISRQNALDPQGEGLHGSGGVWIEAEMYAFLRQLFNAVV